MILNREHEILGTRFEAIERAEDRELFKDLCEKLKCKLNIAAALNIKLSDYTKC